jgi:hypothetical protein
MHLWSSQFKQIPPSPLLFAVESTLRVFFLGADVGSGNEDQNRLPRSGILLHLLKIHVRLKRMIPGLVGFDSDRFGTDKDLHPFCHGFLTMVDHLVHRRSKSRGSLAYLPLQAGRLSSSTIFDSLPLDIRANRSASATGETHSLDLLG